jgi:catalase (peroxidase I)
VAQCVPVNLCVLVCCLSLAVLTTDVALLHDPVYLQWVKTYAENEDALRHAFQHGECAVDSLLH